MSKCHLRVMACFMCQTMEQEEPRHAGIKFAENVLMMMPSVGPDLTAACVPFFFRGRCDVLGARTDNIAVPCRTCDRTSERRTEVFVCL